MEILSMNGLLKQFQESSALYGSNAYYIEDLYEQYLENPQSVAESWREKFAAFSTGVTDTPHSPIVERFATLALVRTVGEAASVYRRSGAQTSGGGAFN
jgi:2-oxoglutarate dehydrogenase complex dehydrogenase (E1) component-like enzyme